MAQFDIQRALCVNNVVVPVTRGVHGIQDPYSLSELDLDGMSVDLVHFRAHDPWVIKILQVFT